MAQKPETDSPESPKSAATTRNPPSGGHGSPGRTEGGATPRKGAHVSSQGRRRYLVASRRTPGLSPFRVASLSMDDVEQALRSSPDIEVVGKLGPKSVLGTLADGMSGTPHVIVAHMDDRKAEIVHQQGQGQLIVERDQPLSLLDAPFAPPTITASVSGTPGVPVQVLVIAEDDSPVEGAEVYLYGSLLPVMGVTNSSGQVTLSLVGDTPQSVRAIQVRPKGDYWSFFQSQPLLDPAQPNIVTLKSLSATFANFPNQQVMGWGQKAMRLDLVPPDHRGQGVKIAIIDSGAATSHEDLRDINKGVDIVGPNPQANNWQVDTLSHGSHCAGVISGHSDAKVGIVGFAPAAEIHVCKIFPGGQISALIDALEYCIEQQIDIVNLSLGMDQVSELLEQQLLRVAGLGIACIVAAGNSGGAVQYPASSPNVLAVAAIGRLGEFPPDSSHAQTVQSPGPDGYFSPRFTCFGPEIAVCAPGVAVVSSVPPNNFAAWDGTSMAAPHVTGLAALVLAHHPDFAGAFKARTAHRVARLFQILKASARPVNVGDLRRTGFGIPDAPTALGLQVTTHVVSQTPLTTQAFTGQTTGQPLGGAIGSLYGSPTFAPNVGLLGALQGAFRPFMVDPVTGGAYAVQAQPGQAANGRAYWTVGNPPPYGSMGAMGGGAGPRGYWAW